MNCSVLKCHWPATFRLVWDDSGQPELCCERHADGYAANHNVMSRAFLELI